MPALADAVEGVSESATLAINARSQNLIAAGVSIINLSAGQPDFEPPEHVLAAVTAAANTPECHRYGSSQGRADLRTAIAERYGGAPSLGPDNVLITNGGKQAIYNFFRAVLTDGAEVLLPAPFWPTFPAAILLNGGRPVAVTTRANDNYAVNVEALESARTERTRALVIASPGNPTGAIQTEGRLAAISDWARAHDIWILFDRTYEDLVFNDTDLPSLPELDPQSLNHTVTVSSVSKGFAMPGWRVGWILGHHTIVAAMTRIQSHSSSNVSIVAQAAALAALTGPQALPRMMRAAYTARSNVAQEVMNQYSCIRYAPPAGAFFVFIELLHESCGSSDGPSRVGKSEQHLGGRLAEALLEEHQVAVVPGAEFGMPSAIRASLTVPPEQIRTSFSRIGLAVTNTLHRT